MTTDQNQPEPGLAGRLRNVGFARVTLGSLLVWYALSAVVVFALPPLVRSGIWPWAMPASDEIQSWYWMVAFMVSAFGLTLVRAMRKHVSVPVLAVLVIGPWLLGYLALMRRADVGHSRAVALVSATAGAGLLIAPAIIPSVAMPHVTVATVVAAALAGLFGSRRSVEPERTAVKPVERTVINTALVPLEITYESGLIADKQVPGGALARLGRGLLLATGRGTWYEIAWDSGQSLRARQLNIPAPPTNLDRLPENLEKPPWLRVTGLAVSATPESVTVYVAHEAWRPDERCLVLQVSAMRLHGTEAADTGWRPVYVTRPCISLDRQYDRYETGGRLLLQSDGSLLLTVGDFGKNRETQLSQDPDGDYGKTLRIGPHGKRSLFTMGHRNPGGLTADRAGNLWEAEHGPRGGDELNLLVAGANYGWPITTYGTDYGTYRWRNPPPDSPRSPFREPSFVFTPSVAISSIIALEGTRFKPWAGDLLAGSLNGERLLRFRLTGTRPVYAEPLQINRRIRDLVEGEDGRIVLWTDGGDLVWLEPASDVMLGAFAYEVCKNCHGSLGGAVRRTVPPLAGVIGRKVASLTDFAYSDGLRKVDGVWTEQRLDAFLESPSRFAPGNTMSFPGIANSVERRLILDFIREESRQAARDTTGNR